jgi:flagellar biosynthetic protein FliO
MDELLKKVNRWWRKADSRQRGYAVIAGIGILCTLLFFIATSVWQPDYEVAGAGTDRLEDPLYYVGVAAKTLAVMLLIVGGAIVLKRLQNRPGRDHAERTLAIVDSTRLSPKQALHVVRVGNQHYLVGATDQSINLISTVYLPEQAHNADNHLPVKRFSFEAMLARAAENVGELADLPQEEKEQLSETL